MNPFWSPTVQRSVMMESPGLPQQAGRLWREAQAGGYGEAPGWSEVTWPIYGGRH